METSLALNPKHKNDVGDFLVTAGKFVFNAAVEVVKDVAAKVFLELSVVYLFSYAKKVKLAYTIVRTNVVTAPIGEEIIFRGIVQRGVGLCQTGWNRFFYCQQPSKKTLERQKAIRIMLTGALFGLSHYRQDSTSLSNLKRCSWTFFVRH